MKPVILTFVRRYLPGYKSGGPVRTIANMVSLLSGELDFRIVTLDRDVGDRGSYRDVRVNRWNRVDGADVFYIEESRVRLRTIARLLNETPHNVLYLNSFFDPKFTVLPLVVHRLGMVNESPIVLAPRGQFSEGALALKQWKKKPFLMAVRSLGLYRNLIWQVSSQHEERDVRRVMGAVAPTIRTAPDLPTAMPTNTVATRVRQEGTPLRIIFVSRITPQKNLEFALNVLFRVSYPLEFSIVGPIEDQNYMRLCRRQMERLPKNVVTKVLGSVEHSEIPRLMAEHDLFFLPTRGENYGHVIAEALSVGTPVLLSDTTPWRGLKGAGVGWDIPLHAEQEFVEAIETTARRAGNDYLLWRQQVAKFAFERLTHRSSVEANRQLFLDASKVH